ncbi:endospore germination permease [Bacillus sp. 31A1R]|uniref:Endospore germination permease n=1 Tax=Robertmurraya mangrovi TaxID=3098077 RepID=A0ABU5IWB3_9BACI|nr:endospore germination permease [Bacillus sp. 31A1R]MDZ5471415.1 endospore germination permease [Bacillus sp. 31A1R]
MENLTKILIPRQMFLLLVLSTGLLNHVILIPNLLKASGRDSWICVLIAYPIAIIFIWLLHYIIKHSSHGGFFPMIRYRFGRVVSYLFTAPIILFLITSTYITVRDLVIWLSAYFLAETPVIVINLLIISACYFITLSGIKYMAISSGFLLPLVVLLGIMIAVVNTSVKDPNLLFPVISDGYLPVVKGVMYVLAGLFEVYIVLLLQPFAQEPIKFKHLFILLTFLTMLIFGPLTASIMEFGPIESKHFRYPAYEQWRILNIGEYISNLDFFALYQWLSGGLIRISLFMFLLGVFFAKNKRERLNIKLVTVLFLLLFSSLLIKVETYYFYKFIYLYFLPGIMMIFLSQTALAALIVFVLKKRDEHNAKNNKMESTT